MSQSQPQKVAMQASEALQIALTLQSQGKLQQAEQIYRNVLNTLPNHPDALHGLGVLMHKAGRNDMAVEYLSNAFKQQPKHAELAFNLGLIYAKQYRFKEGAKYFSKALALKPDYAQAHYRLGLIHFHSRNYAESVKSLQRALKLTPADIEIQKALAQIFTVMGRTEEALAQFRELAEGDARAKDIAAYGGVGNAYLEQGRLDEAEAVYRACIAAHPDHAGGYANLAYVLGNKGEKADVEEACRKCIALDPHYSDIYSLLTQARKFDLEKDKADFEHMEALLTERTDDTVYQSNLHFALGRAYDDAKAYDKAWPHFVEGNRLRHVPGAFNRQDALDFERQTRDLFTRNFVKKLEGKGHPSTQPIFILGTPRSGTTLIEQVLSSHPLVEAGGEMRHMTELLKSLPLRIGSLRRYPACVAELTPEQLPELAEAYLHKIQDFLPKAKYITDKQVNNFAHLGTIKLLLPNAKIIHCMREPLDSCLSMYFQRFLIGNEYSFDLDDVGFFYRQYQKLMQFWREAFPGGFMEVQYEEMVEDPESKVREILDYCGLPWDDNCLKFYDTVRPVKTASTFQVRQPIYTQSKARWKHYEPHLGPLKRALGISD